MLRNVSELIFLSMQEIQYSVIVIAYTQKNIHAGIGGVYFRGRGYHINLINTENELLISILVAFP